jgi:mevalonate pyrophosphate decarboxylase
MITGLGNSAQIAAFFLDAGPSAMVCSKVNHNAKEWR